MRAKSRRLRWTGHVNKMEEIRSACRVVMWKPSWELAGSCEHDNEASGSIKGGEFFDYLSDC